MLALPNGMEPLIGSLQAALAVAMATTFDDNIYLTGFFSETNRDFRPIHVVVGELLGFTALISSSVLASRLLAATVPISLTGWLGLMPILIGLASLIELLQSRRPRQRSAATTATATAASSRRLLQPSAVTTAATTGVTTAATDAATPASATPVAAASTPSSTRSQTSATTALTPAFAALSGTAAARSAAAPLVRQPGGFGSSRPSLGSVLRHRRTYMVSAVTISNGGNNLAIYIPLLGTSSAFAAALTVVVCYLAVACWLLLSFRLTRLPGVAVTLSRYGRRLFPFVLMWLGFRILHDSGVLADLRSLG